ncbi:hypothetical protein AMAG_16181 [Allomyces macrogynus ATCC 38327]|uniref:FAD-binding FR-type domain-containing protein n=1 Tax=Allomyces macrogynus (strain ATCC 38327) TaxID=578462 RepID=A0A0L0TA53_ALLM3|nr:hypothetical protein AMAG_16181 [Allomyces macrogynus ATCC 38327]|eukprot:KNE71622.1 hypothetical protein AMAG_16181 [Allomyces macrogynus ATCC 38327]
MSLVGDGIPAAKAAAACLNWNSAIIFITFHRYVGYAIVLFTWIHVMAHNWNYRALGLATTYSAEWYALVSGPGLTGQVVTVALIIMVTAAARRTRRAHFEIFWYSHHLFLVYIAALLPHGAYYFVKWQFLEYIVGAATLYLIERLLREVTGWCATQIVKVVLHPASVVELRIEKPSAPRMRPGQYVWLNVPSVAPCQWHPFILTSAPDDAYYSVHMRVVGDWTRSVAHACGISFTDENWTAPAVHLHWLAQGGTLRTKKVHFVWVCRDANAFEWFQARLHALEVALPDLVELHMYLTAPLTADQITNVVMHDMTVAAGAGDDGKHGGEAVRDAVSGLASNTYYGRPHWPTIFEGLTRSYPSTDIGVFCCGPKPLSHEMHVLCNEYTVMAADAGRRSGNESPVEFGTRFFYHKGTLMGGDGSQWREKP